MEAPDFPRRPIADKFLQLAIVPAHAYRRTKFKLSSSITFGDMRGSQKKVGAPDFPKRSLTDNFLYLALVRVNTYKCAKFQFHSSISY